MKFFTLFAFLAAASTILAYSTVDLDPQRRDLDFEDSLEARYYESELSPRYDEELSPRYEGDLLPRYEAELAARYDQGFELDERSSSEVELAPRVVQMVLMAAKQLVQQVVKAVIKAVISLISDIKDEKKNREIFVKNLLAGLVSKNPKFNYMIIHPKHTASWAGTAGKDWHKEHVECDTIRLLKKTIGYDIYAGQAGEVQLQGDGSFINWAFQGRFTRSGNQGHTVKFTKMN